MFMHCLLFCLGGPSIRGFSLFCSLGFVLDVKQLGKASTISISSVFTDRGSLMLVRWPVLNCKNILNIVLYVLCGNYYALSLVCIV
uniref:60S ribosomal protein L31 n=1 Tax=Arundo donax TaxID=35708 RepID=A0A0A9HJC3_ARUDO